MKKHHLLHAACIVLASALLGGVIFLSLSIGLIYIFGALSPSTGTEVAPSMGTMLYLFFVLLGTAGTTVFSGLYGYRYYRKACGV
jgi:ABC-type antimicrobial peptide transport system permease subunit